MPFQNIFKRFQRNFPRGFHPKKGEFLFGGIHKTWTTRRFRANPLAFPSLFERQFFLENISPKKPMDLPEKISLTPKKNTDSKEMDGRGTCCRMGLLLEKPKPSKKSSRLQVGPMGSSGLVRFLCLQNVGQDVGASQSWATRCGL